MAGVGIAAFGLSFLLRGADDPSAGRLGLTFFAMWAVLFVVVGVLHLVAGLWLARGARWALSVGLAISIGGAALGFWALAVALSHVTRQMDALGTIGLALVSVLYAVAGWSLLSARDWGVKPQ